MPLYKIQLDVPEDVLAGIHDICRLFVIQVVAQFLLFCSDSDKFPFFSSIFFQTLLFLLTGAAVYWLVIRKIVQFETVQGHSGLVSEHSPMYPPRTI
jgi:hypothetical protein